MTTPARRRETRSWAVATVAVLGAATLVLLPEATRVPALVLLAVASVVAALGVGLLDDPARALALAGAAFVAVGAAAHPGIPNGPLALSLAIAAPPLAAGLGVASLLRGGPAALAACGGLLAGPVRMAFYDPFRDGECMNCGSQALLLADAPGVAAAAAWVGGLAIVAACLLSLGAGRRWFPALAAVVVLVGLLTRGWARVPDVGPTAAVALTAVCAAGLDVARPLAQRRRLRELAAALRAGHDPVPGQRDLLLDPALSNPEIRLVREERQVTDALARQVEEVAASRERLVRQGDDERRRLERDLHDGAQQSLLALGFDVTVALADPALTPDHRDRLQTCRTEIAEALAELRELSHGLYPPLLEAAGLRPALAALARRGSNPIGLDGDWTERPGSAVERTCYLVVADLAERSEAPLRIRASGHSGAGRWFTMEVVGSTVAPDHLLVERVRALGGTVRETPAPVPSLVVDLPCG